MYCTFVEVSGRDWTPLVVANWCKKYTTIWELKALYYSRCCTMKIPSLSRVIGSNYWTTCFSISPIFICLKDSQVIFKSINQSFKNWISTISTICMKDALNLFIRGKNKAFLYVCHNRNSCDGSFNLVNKLIYLIMTAEK